MTRRPWPALLVLLACADASERGTAASFESAIGGPAELAVLRAAEAVGYTGPGGQVFEVRLRTPAVDQYPCSTCHVGSATAEGHGAEAHADVRPAHPSALTERCGACHGTPDPAELSLQNGQVASLDHAYRLCAQCHYGRAADWAGGAHGKRIVGWRGRRVVMSCTECHDPHAPALASRIPFKAPNIPRTARSDP